MKGMIFLKTKNMIYIVMIFSIFILFTCSIICKANTVNYANSNIINTKEEQRKDPYDEKNEKQRGFKPTIIVQSFVFGAIVSTIVCVIIGFKHRPVKIAKNANQYLDTNSINITNGYDRFTNYTINKVPINKK